MIFNSLLRCLLLFVGLSTSLHPLMGAERIKFVTTIPEIAWMAQEIGGDHIEARALLRGTENPHFVDAVPDFIRLVSEAQVVCVVGLDLEVGYMPAVLSKSGNAKVQVGGPGYCEIGRSVELLDKPEGAVDRSMGDVHPGGNPHFWLSPKRLAQGGKELVKVLIRVNPKQASVYEKGLASFQSKMATLSKEIDGKLEPLRKFSGGKPIVIEYHKEFAYFLQDYGLRSFGSIEEKPGVPPSAGRLLEISRSAKEGGVKVGLAADYNPSKTVKRFEEMSSIPLVVVPTMFQTNKSIHSYPELQAFIADSLVKASVKGQ